MAASSQKEIRRFGFVDYEVNIWRESMIKLIVHKIRKIFSNNDSYIELLKEDGVTIGKGCDIAKSANFGSEPWLISIGNNVRVTQRVQFITHDGGLWTLRKMGLIKEEDVKYGSISIGNNCNISWNSIIMPNVHIGNNVVIAAGAVVTKNVPDGEVWGGVPAKKIETVEEYFSKIVDDTEPTNGMSSREKREYLVQHRPDLFNNPGM